MTNAQIIFEQSQRLAENGLINYTGRVIPARLADGTPTEIRETEDIHTFAEWKKAGYMVKKGQHAVAKFTIWMFTDRPRRQDAQDASQENAEQEADPHYYMKMAAFFSASQVQPIEA